MAGVDDLLGAGHSTDDILAMLNDPAFAKAFADNQAYENQQNDRQYGLQQGQLDLSRLTQQQQHDLAEQQLAWQRQQGLSQLGLNYLTQAAQLGGPADYFQSANFYRGAQNLGQVPAFLAALQNNLNLPAFNAPTQGQAPAVQSMGTLAAQLQGQPVAPVRTGVPAPISAPPVPGANPLPSGVQSTGDPVKDAALGKIAAINQAGAQKLGPQALESLTPDEMDLFKSGLRAVGGSLPAFMAQYSASRVGQNAATSY